jgi:prevent-host-death family protein
MLLATPRDVRLRVRCSHQFPTNSYPCYPVATMVTVAAKELKNRLGRYLQMVREGQPVRITDHGKPIGCILPLEKPSGSTELAELSRLLATGGLTLGRGNLRRHWKPAALKPGPTTTEMIAEDRR